MGTKVECPLCRKMHKNWQDYTEHLLESHTDDEDRCQWAKDMIELSKNGNKPKEIEPVKYGGKPVDKAPPARKLPKYLQRQLEE